MARSLLQVEREQPYTCVRSIVINVSFNELAIGSESPTQRPTPSRPAEASTFATMMDEADARQSASDAGRQRSAETRASVDNRDTTRAERPASAAEPSSVRETNDAPVADTNDKSAAPIANDKAETVSADGKTETVTPQDKTAVTAPRDTGAKTATAPSTIQTGNEKAVATSNTANQPAMPVAASTPAPQDATDQIPTDEAAADAAQVLVQVPAVALIHTPAPPTAVAATVVPSFVAAHAAAPIGAPQATTPAPQNNGTQPTQPVPQQAAALPNTAQTLPDAASASNTATPLATPTFTAPAATPAVPATPAATGKPAASTATNSNATSAAPIAANNTAPGKSTDKTGNVTAATLFAATALSQPTADSNSQPQTPVTPQAAASNTANTKPAALDASAAPIAPQSATSTTSRTAQTAAPLTATDPAQTDPRVHHANATPAVQPATPNTVQANSAVPAPMTAATLAALIGGSSRIDITVDQATAPAPLKPAPSLANGMAAQIANTQAPSSEAKTGSAAPTLGAIDPNAATQTITPTQTAMAVAAGPMAQAVADEPKPKLAATADGLVVNAPAPTSGHTTHTAALDASAAASKPTVPNQPVFDQVAVHVAKAAAEGLDKINIKLKPVSLGQIEVQLEVATDGRVHAVIAADKPETLDLLQRDARALERALGDAGLRTDSGSLSFNLRGQGQQQFGGNASYAGFGGAERSRNDITVPAADNAMRLGAYLNSRAAAGGVDIRV